MRYTTVSIARPEGAANIATHLPVQIDQAKEKEVADLRAWGWQGRDLWHIYTMGWGADTTHRFQRADVLTDEMFTDPETGLAYTYRIVSRVKDYDLDHQECLAETVVGG